MLYISISKSPVWKRIDPIEDARPIGVVKPGDIIDVKSTNKDGWFVLNRGFVYSKDSDGNDIFSKNIQKYRVSQIQQTRVKERDVLFDGEESKDENKQNDFPKDHSSYDTEDGKHVNVVKNSDGTYSKSIAYKNAAGSDCYDYYTYDSSGNNKSVTYTGAEKDGFRDSTTITYDSDGNPTTESTKYHVDEGSGTIMKTTVKTDKDGNILESSDEAANTDNKAVNDWLEDTGEAGSTYELSNGLKIRDIFGIHGMPYQFMTNVDPVLDGSDLGRLYADRVVARMPLFIMTPGEPEFLAGWSDDERREQWTQMLEGLMDGSNLNKVLKRQGRFYGFKGRWDMYLHYVHPILQTAAHFLGIDRVAVPHIGDGQILGMATWEHFYNKDIHNKLNYRNAIAFYVNADTQISNNFSNSTTQSQLAEKINQGSAIAKQAQFLMGTAGASLSNNTMMRMGEMGNNNDVRKTLSGQEMADDALASGDFLHSIGANIGTVLQGGKMIFPDIWDDSSFIPSYNVTIKLRCPNPDPVSWFLDIWAPIAHLLPFVLPKSSGPNGYIAPFLIRGYYKGLFNCNMGIVTSMDITRGETGNWTLDGLPTAVDISITIKDLYNVLSVSSETDTATGLINNLALLDFIANACGININEPDLGRILRMYMHTVMNIPHNKLMGIAAGLDNWVTNRLQNMFRL